MSRHRAVRDMAKSRDYEDDMDGDDDDDFGTSPASPSGAISWNKPAAKGSGLGAFLSPGAAKPVPRTSGFDVPKPEPPLPSSPLSASPFGIPPPGFTRPLGTPQAASAERLAECLSAIYNVLGDRHGFSIEALTDAARKANYDATVAISSLLDGPGAATPKAPALIGNSDSSSPSSTLSPSALPSETETPVPAPSRPALVGAFVRPAFGAKRAAHPSAKLPTVASPTYTTVSTATPSIVPSSTNSAPLPPPVVTPPPASVSPSANTLSPSAFLSATFPSLFCRLLCGDVSSTALPASFLSSFSWSEWQAGAAKGRFAFTEPSPDDLVLEKRKAAFQQLHSAAPATPSSASAPNTLVFSKTPVKVDAPTPTKVNTPISLTASGNVPLSKPAAAGASLTTSGSVPLPDDVQRVPSPQPKGRKFPKQHPAARRKELETKIAENKEEKVRLNLVVIGHVDAGKSTLMGHMLYALGAVSQKTMTKFERDSQKEGKGSFAYAWVLDAHGEERARGITMDVAVEHFETPHRYITLLDAPGHRDFVPNMISGAAQADCAILVVNARTGEFETGFEANGQTREHAVLAKSLGVQQLIVAVNQLDAVQWSKERFDAIVARLSAFLKQIGFKENTTWFVPVSGWTGENLVKRQEVLLQAWYTGPTLLERIDAFVPPTRLVLKPFRLCVSDVYKGLNMGVIAVGGKIEAGLVAVNDNLLVLPACELCTVKTVMSNHESVQVAVAGDNVELGLQGLDPAVLGPGSVLCDPEAPVSVVKKFTAQIITFSPLAHPITQGMHIIVHVQNVNEAGFLSKLVAITDRNNATVIKKRPKILPEKTNAVVEITLHRPLCVELYSSFAQLGRFMIRDSGRTIAAGIITELGDQLRF